jgi:hypothetical protein
MGNWASTNRGGLPIISLRQRPHTGKSLTATGPAAAKLRAPASRMIHARRRGLPTGEGKAKGVGVGAVRPQGTA